MINNIEVHEKRGHQNKDNREEMSKYIVIKLQGRIAYTACGLFISWEKVIAKVIKKKSHKSGERVCTDTIGPYLINIGGARNCMCALYEFTDLS